MALIAALLPAVLALRWYVDDPQQAEAVRAALDDLWPSSGIVVSVGPPERGGSEGAVWWDGDALRMTEGDQDRQAPGVSDPSVQVAMVRGWLARPDPEAETPPAAEDQDEPAKPKPTLRPLLLQVGAGPALRLPEAVAGEQASLIIGGRRGHLEAGTMLTVGVGERSRGPDGELHTEDRIELEGAFGLRWALGADGDLWVFGSTGTRQSLVWVPGTLELGSIHDALGSAVAFVDGIGLQVTGARGGQEVGARLRVSTSLGSPAEIEVGDGAAPYRPGLISLELIVGLGGHS